jgi:hypothetical protein
MLFPQTLHRKDNFDILTSCLLFSLKCSREHKVTHDDKEGDDKCDLPFHWELIFVSNARLCSAIYNEFCSLHKASNVALVHRKLRIRAQMQVRSEPRRNIGPKGMINLKYEIEYFKDKRYRLAT